MDHPRRGPLESCLTDRQAQVLVQLAEGKTTKMIAREMQRSHRTVEIHRCAATRALGARNSTHAAVLLDRERQAIAAGQQAA